MEFTDPFEAMMPLFWRIVVGLTILALLLASDLRKHGSKSTRLREYGFILVAVSTTVVYATIHDLITSNISPEYFLAGKGLPPDHLTLRAAWLGARAAIGPGALIGASLVIANNPTQNRMSLDYLTLFRSFRWIAAVALLTSIGFGLLGACDVRNLTPTFEGGLEQPRRFIAVWGIHWGTYVGGLVGLCIAITNNVRRKPCRPLV